MSDSAFALRQVREQIKAKLDERNAVQGRVDAANAEVDAIVAAANNERRDISDAEVALMADRRADVAKLIEERDAVDAGLDGLKQRESLLEQHEASKIASRAAAASWAGVSDNPEQPTSSARVKSEPRTYSPDSERRGVSFFNDVYQRWANQESQASERLARHGAEVRLNELAGYEARDVGTSAFSGLVVPQYLTELVAPVARAMAPTLEIVNRHPLPASGMTVNISRMTTGLSVTAQSAEFDAASETNQDDTLLTVNVRTYSGQQDISRQALERGTGVDEITLQDLAAAYWTKIDGDVLNGLGTNGTHTGIRSTGSIVSVTYTTTTPTAAVTLTKTADLIQQVQSGVYAGITHFIMHPRRWWWLATNLSTSVPLVTVPGAGTQQVGTLGGGDYTSGGRGWLGLPVILDGNMATNIGTNEDVIIGVTARELHFWNDPGAPMFIRAEQPQSAELGVKFVVYGYSAFTAGRYPGAHGVVTGTGMTAPTF